jgi:HemY protein
MLRFLVLLAILFAIAFGFQWLKGVSGEVAVTVGDNVYAVEVTVAVIALIAIMLVTMGLIWFVRETMRAPWRMARGWRNRNRERGRAAISQGLIAIAAGDLRSAERAMHEASRRAPDQPLTLLLEAQTAQLKGDRNVARKVFQRMTEDSATRIAGLRGLHIEAEREGVVEAAHQIAAQARAEAPSAAWAARALLRHQTAAHDWDGALSTLSGATDGRILDRRTARRLRAVILAAKALDMEIEAPDTARHAAIEAHDLAPDLVPAAAVAAGLLSRQGDIRRATRILEAAWKAGPHPEIAEAYLHVRAGDAARDRLERAETLFRLRPHADEGRHAVAQAAIDARDFARAREILTPVLTERPTRRALMLMAELEEAETGDRGRAREWLARAVNAPRDPAWTADGVVLEEWAPVSPVTGRLDTVEWKVPVAEIEGPRLTIDAAELQPIAIAAAEPVIEQPAPAAGLEGTPPLPSAVAPQAENTDMPANVTGQPTAVAPLSTAAGDSGSPRPAEPMSALETNLARARSTKDSGLGGDRAKPPIPDDPGVVDDEERDERSFRALSGR